MNPNATCDNKIRTKCNLLLRCNFIWKVRFDRVQVFDRVRLFRQVQLFDRVQLLDRVQLFDKCNLFGRFPIGGRWQDITWARGCRLVIVEDKRKKYLVRPRLYSCWKVFDGQQSVPKATRGVYNMAIISKCNFLLRCNFSTNVQLLGDSQIDGLFDDNISLERRVLEVSGFFV